MKNIVIAKVAKWVILFSNETSTNGEGQKSLLKNVSEGCFRVRNNESGVSPLLCAWQVLLACPSNFAKCVLLKTYLVLTPNTWVTYHHQFYENWPSIRD